MRKFAFWPGAPSAALAARVSVTVALAASAFLSACAAREPIENAFTLAEHSEALVNGAKTISQGYVAPPGIQGVKDAVLWENGSPHFDGRYQVLGQWGAAVAHAWYAWDGIDLIDDLCPLSEGLSDAQCAAVLAQRCGHPLTQMHGRSYCFAQFRSSGKPGVGYDDRRATPSDQFVKILRAHAQAGIQTAYHIEGGGPKRYSYRVCVDSGAKHCVPRKDVLLKMSDAIEYVARRFNCAVEPCSANGEAAFVGKISHFIVGNEVSESQYFDVFGMPRDAQPAVLLNTHQAGLSNGDMDQWAHHYAAMMAAVHDGIAASGRKGVMLWTSFAATFGVDTFQGSAYSINTQRLLDALKADLGIQRDWSIGIHAYGKPIADPSVANPDWYVTENLAALSRQMSNWLKYLGATVPEEHPQMKLFLSEQSYSRAFPGAHTAGITYPRDRKKVAEWMCQVHHYATRNPNVLLVTHEHLQAGSVHSSLELAGQPPPPDGNIEHYGLIPWDHSVGVGPAENLMLGEPAPAGQPPFAKLAAQSDELRIYRTTFANGDWRKNDTNVCCRDFGVGCLNAPSVSGRAVRLEVSDAEVALVGWACSPRTILPLEVEVRSGPYWNNPIPIKRARADRAPESGIAPVCAPNDVAHGFRVSFTRDELLAHEGRELSTWAIDLNDSGVVLPSEGWAMPSVPNFHPVIGKVDGLARTGNQLSLQGWACAKGVGDNVTVEVRGGPFPGTNLIVTRANALNEPAVTSMCATSWAHYRFSVPFSRAQLEANLGRQLLVHALSPDGGGHVFLPADAWIGLPTSVPSWYQ